MSKKSLIQYFLVISFVPVGLVCVGCEEQGKGNPSEQKAVEKKQQNRKEKQSKQKEKNKKDPDQSEFPLYEIEYPGTREQFKKFKWIGEKLDRLEKNLSPHRLKITLPEGTTLKSLSRFTSLTLAENGIVLMTIHPLMEGVTYKEAADKMVDRIKKWDVQMSDNEKKTLREINELKEKSPRRKPGMISETSVSGKLNQKDQYHLTFKLKGTRGRKGWYYNVTFYLENPLRDKVKGRKDPVYKIKIGNVAEKKENTYEYINQHYTLSVEIRDKKGNTVYSEDPDISLFTGHLVYIPRGRSPIEVPKVPKKGDIRIQIKPDKKKENKSMEDFKYLPLDKTIPGKDLTEGQTINLKLKKNPEYKGN